MVSCRELVSLEEISQIKDYLLLDLETTGPDPEKDGIFELGMIRVIGNRIVNRARTYADPERPVPPERAEAAGIDPEVLSAGLSQRQLASSLAGLLLGNVAVAEPAHIGFVLTLLNRYPCQGEIAYIDVRSLAASALGLDPEQDVEHLADGLDLKSEEEHGVLRRCELRRELLRACLSLSTKKTPGSAKAKKKKKTASRAALPRPRRRRRRRRRRKPGKPITDWEIVQYVAAGISLTAALLSMPSLAGALFALSALILLPIRYLREKLRRRGIRGWMVAAFGLALFIAGFLLRPTTAPTQRQGNDDRIPAYIVLSYDEPGSYGSWVDEGSEEAYLKFYLPAGIYRVLNNTPDAATVTVLSDDEEEAELEPLPEDQVVGQSNTITVLGSKSQTITVKEGHYVTLSKNSKNVIFQYLSEIPEVVVTDDPNLSNEPKQVKLAYVNGTDVRMRRSPSVGAFIMATYDTGKEVEVTGTVGEWTAVHVDRRDGYIYSKYLTDVNPLASVSTETPEDAEGESAEASEAAAESEPTARPHTR